jgi:exonuclease VII small subunit
MTDAAVTLLTMTTFADKTRELERVVRRLDRDTARRDELIRELHAGGASLRKIAEHAGITHAGVKRVIERG